MEIGDITNDGWEINKITVEYRKRVITLDQYISKTIGFKKGIEGWLYVSDLKDMRNGIIILDNNLTTNFNYNPKFFKILNTDSIVRKNKLEKIKNNNI